MLYRAWTWMVALALFAGPIGAASAQTEDEETPPAAPADEVATDPIATDETTDADTPALDTSDLAASDRLGDQQVLAEEELGAEIARSSTDPWEDPERAYFFLGIAYWHTFTPSFILDIFTDEATKANNPALALQFTYRKDALDIVTSVYYQSFAVNGPFRGPGDDVTETEIIDSSLKMLAVSVDILWSTEITDWLAFEYGIGLGVGGVFGNLVRTEAYPDDGGWARCDGEGSPGALTTGNPAYCDPPGTGGQFRMKEPRWTHGGSTPNVWFRASIPHLALRIKPIKQVMIRLDGGFDILSGFFVGGSLNFGFGG